LLFGLITLNVIPMYAVLSTISTIVTSSSSKTSGKISGGDDPDEIKLPPETSSITPPPITPPAIAITMAKAPIIPPTSIFGFNKVLEF